MTFKLTHYRAAVDPGSPELDQLRDERIKFGPIRHGGQLLPRLSSCPVPSRETPSGTGGAGQEFADPTWATTSQHPPAGRPTG